MWATLTRRPPTLRGRLLCVGLCCLAAGCLLGLSLAALTYKWAGVPGITAMVAALTICLISNMAGTLPACWALGLKEQTGAKPFLTGMVLRVIVLLLLTVPTVLADQFPLRPLLLWVAGGYSVLLLVETTLIASWIRNSSQVTR